MLVPVHRVSVLTLRICYATWTALQKPSLKAWWSSAGEMTTMSMRTGSCSGRKASMASFMTGFMIFFFCVRVSLYNHDCLRSCSLLRSLSTSLYAFLPATLKIRVMNPALQLCNLEYPVCIFCFSSLFLFLSLVLTYTFTITIISVHTPIYVHYYLQ